MSVQTVIPPADVPWQNLANRINDIRQFGLQELSDFEAELNDQLAALQRPTGGGGVGAPPPAPGKDTGLIRRWADFASAVIAYALIFYGLMAAAHAFGFFTFGIVIALLAITFLLRVNLVAPLQSAVRAIVGAILDIIDELVQFFIQWVQGIIQYFQGDFVRAVLQILILAAFSWIWELAQSIPAIRGVLDFIGNAIRTVVKFINDVFDQVTAWVEQLRRNIEDSIRVNLSNMGTFGQQLTDSIIGVVDRLFTGLESRINRLRFELVGQVDFLSQALRATVTVFGYKFQLLPEETRNYIRSFQRAKPRDTLADQAELYALAGAGTGTTVRAVTPVWAIAEDYTRQLRTLYAGGTNPLADTATALVATLQQLNRGEVPETPDYPPAWLTAPIPGQVPTGPPPAPGRPPWVPALDWQTVQGICGADHVAYLAAAIGQHETGWGALGAGRDGFILGVGVFGGVQQAQFRGLTNQLDWACPRLRSAFPGPETVTRDAVVAFGRDVYQVPDYTGWGNDVFALYASVFLGNVPSLA